MIDQSQLGAIGFHNESPGINCSLEDPVFTFANHTCAMRWMVSPFSCIQNVFAFKGAEGIETSYLYYASMGRVVLEEYKGHVPQFRSMWLPVAPSSEQLRIGLLLRELDDRIDLLRQTNATLETIAQALFKSWFVDFDPVRAKAEGREPEGMDAATAALFPNEFEDSELGPIPKGWTVGRVSDAADIKGGKQLDREQFAPEGRNPIFGGAGEMGRTNLSNADGLVITVGRVGAYCGQFFWHLGPAWVNNNASSISPAANSGFWIYWCLRNADIGKIKKGAAQPFVSNSDIAALFVVMPPQELVSTFHALALEMHKRMANLADLASHLTMLRDTLLPRLISGKLRLPDGLALAEVDPP